MEVVELHEPKAVSDGVHRPHAKEPKEGSVCPLGCPHLRLSRVSPSSDTHWYLLEPHREVGSVDFQTLLGDRWLATVHPETEAVGRSAVDGVRQRSVRGPLRV